MTMPRPPRHRAEDGFSLVELLVVMALMGVVTFAVFTVVRTMTHTERYTSDLRAVMDDARASVSSVRKEIRAARSVLVGTDATALHFWVDRNQDTSIQLDENVWYCVRKLAAPNCADAATTYPAGTGFELVRWTEAATAWTSPTPWPRTPPADSRVIARTLLSPDVFDLHRGSTAVSGAAVIEATRVAFGFEFDAQTASGPDTLHLASNVRLRNVDVE